MASGSPVRITWRSGRRQQYLGYQVECGDDAQCRSTRFFTRGVWLALRGEVHVIHFCTPSLKPRRSFWGREFSVYATTQTLVACSCMSRPTSILGRRATTSRRSHTSAGPAMLAHTLVDGRNPHERGGFRRREPHSGQVAWQPPRTTHLLRLRDHPGSSLAWVGNLPVGFHPSHGRGYPHRRLDPACGTDRAGRIMADGIRSGSGSARWVSRGDSSCRTWGWSWMGLLRIVTVLALGPATATSAFMVGGTALRPASGVPCPTGGRPPGRRWFSSGRTDVCLAMLGVRIGPRVCGRLKRGDAELKSIPQAATLCPSLESEVKSRRDGISPGGDFVGARVAAMPRRRECGGLGGGARVSQVSPVMVKGHGRVACQLTTPAA